MILLIQYIIQELPEDEQNWAQRPKRGGKGKPALRGKQSYLAYKVSLEAILDRLTSITDVSRGRTRSQNDASFWDK